MRFPIVIIFLFLGTSWCTGQVTAFTIDSTKMNRPIMDSLEKLYQQDQATRLKLVQALHEKNKSATDSLWVIIHRTDAQNLIKVKAIITKYGWLGPQKVGFTGSQALFLVIQHADLPTQQKYLPMIRAAENRGEIFSSNLAILEDRVAMREGRKQIYGSQGFTDDKTGKKYLYPIVDIDQLEERRKKMGLVPMKEYQQSLHADWNVETYKQMMPEIERIAKQQHNIH